MKSAKKTDVIDKIKEFQEELLVKKPDIQQMVHEVRMMNFKVRPINGNISDLDFSNMEFIDALWSLGKLDEFFRKEAPVISNAEKSVFFRIVNDLRVEMQHRLRSANIDSAKSPQKNMAGVFELEIIKDNGLHVN